MCLRRSDGQADVLLPQWRCEPSRFELLVGDRSRRTTSSTARACHAVASLPVVEIVTAFMGNPATDACRDRRGGLPCSAKHLDHFAEHRHIFPYGDDKNPAA
jgi:hypothetical protein